MASRLQLSIPATGALPHSHRLLATNLEVVRAISRLSRPSLIALALQWLQKKNRPFCVPYLHANHDPDSADNDDAPYEPAHSHEELQEIYQELAGRKGAKREVTERILEGDWRQGISLYQLAMAETQHLVDHPTALKWSAQRLVKLASSKGKRKETELSDTSDQLPRFHAQTFLLNLVREISPLMKAHYYLNRIKSMPITLLRVYIHDSPYTTEASLRDSATISRNTPEGARSVFLVFPDGSPYVYVSIATHLGQTVGSEVRDLRRIILNTVPKALSKSNARYELQSTSLSARSLSALLTFRGPGHGNAVAGGWSIFTENSFSQNALDFAIAPRPSSGKPSGSSDEETNKENTAPGVKAGRPKRRHQPDGPELPEAKRKKETAAGRFGPSGIEGDGQALERVEVRIDDPFPNVPDSAVADSALIAQATTSNAQNSRRGRRSRPSVLDRAMEELNETERAEPETWRPDVRMIFQGQHVFAGIRQLVEQGVIDGEKMPGWMTGEAGVTVGVVRQGKIMTKHTSNGV